MWIKRFVTQREQEEVHTYGLPAEEIEDVVDTELLSLIGKCQKQEEERLEVLDVSPINSMVMVNVIVRGETK